MADGDRPLDLLYTIKQQAMMGMELIKQYMAEVEANAQSAVGMYSQEYLDDLSDVSMFNNQKLAWKAFREATKIFIIERFKHLSTIGTSEAWAKMKSQNYPVKISGTVRSPVTKPSVSTHANMFGFASGNLMDTILDALNSNEGKNSGFRTIFEVAKHSYTYDFNITNSRSFYHIPFKRRSVAYPKFLDDLLKGKASYVDSPSSYMANGAFSLGLIGRTPLEKEMLIKTAQQIYFKLIHATHTTKLTQAEFKSFIESEFMATAQASFDRQQKRKG